MKSLLTIILSLTLLSLGAATIPNVDNPAHGGEVDIKASTITWLGSKVVGEHSGTISLKSGGLKFENHRLVGGHFIMDMTTITCTDLEGPKANKLVGHLNSADFFEVENHNTAELILTDIVNQKGDIYKIIGNLTIKGITNPVEFEAVVTAGSAKAEISIDRTAYDIKYGSGSFFDNLGDKAINNEFLLTINLVLK